MTTDTQKLKCLFNHHNWRPLNLRVRDGIDDICLTIKVCRTCKYIPNYQGVAFNFWQHVIMLYKRTGRVFFTQKDLITFHWSSIDKSPKIKTVISKIKEVVIGYWSKTWP